MAAFTRRVRVTFDMGLALILPAGRIDVIKNLISSNEALIRAVDDDGLYPGFTGQPFPPVLPSPLNVPSHPSSLPRPISFSSSTPPK